MYFIFVFSISNFIKKQTTFRKEGIYKKLCFTLFFIPNPLLNFNKISNEIAKKDRVEFYFK